MADINGTPGDDTLTGTPGDDTINGLAGADDMSGLAGNDIYIVDNAGDVVNEAAGEGNDHVNILATWTLTPGDEVEILSALFGSGNINVTGNEFGQSLWGNGSNNTLSGGGGADFLNGFGGVDILNGGEGNDILDGGLGIDFLRGNAGDDTYIADGSDVVTEAVGEGFDKIIVTASFFLTPDSEVEILSAGDINGASNFLIQGNDFNQSIWGNAGLNQLLGGGGQDSLSGFNGDDFLDGGPGNDVLDGGEGNDTLRGRDGIDSLFAGNGNDSVDGGIGADDMRGGAGDDGYNVDNAGDVVIELAGEGADDRVAAVVDWTLTAGSQVEVLWTGNTTSDFSAVNLTGNELANNIWGNAGANLLNGAAGNDAVFGFGGNDILFGGDGDDFLVGGEGDDVLFGTFGADVMIGQAGADSFVFNTPLLAGNVDIISDFAAVDDTIGIDDTFFGMPLGALNPNAFVIGAAAADADDRIIYNQANGQLFFDADGNGAGAAILFATLQGTPVISASDFVVF